MTIDYLMMCAILMSATTNVVLSLLMWNMARRHANDGLHHAYSTMHNFITDAQPTAAPVPAPVPTKATYFNDPEVQT